MALPSSGPMSAAMINTELGRSATAPFSMNGAAERALAERSSGSIAMSDFYGKSDALLKTTITIRRQYSMSEITASGQDGMLYNYYYRWAYGMRPNNFSDLGTPHFNGLTIRVLQAERVISQTRALSPSNPPEPSGGYDTSRIVLSGSYNDNTWRRVQVANRITHRSTVNWRTITGNYQGQPARQWDWKNSAANLLTGPYTSGTHLLAFYEDD